MIAAAQPRCRSPRRLGWIASPVSGQVVDEGDLVVEQLYQGLDVLGGRSPALQGLGRERLVDTAAQSLRQPIGGRHGVDCHR